MVDPHPAAARVLLLEDSDADAELVIRRLERSGLPLEIAHAPDRATYLRVLAQGEPALVLADYSLPDYDGMAALEAARSLYPFVPVIFISGRVGEEVAIDAVHRGATDYVLKQRLERLVPAVARALKEAEEHATRLRAEQLFRESETRFRDVMDSLPQMVWVSSSEGELLYTNSAWDKLVPAGATGWLDEGMMHPEDQPTALGAWRHAVAAHAAFSCECRLKEKEGAGYRWHLVRMVPLVGTRAEPDGSGEPRAVDWLGTATDMQEQKLNEEALRTAEKLAVTGRMLASIAHEINNPLESLTNLIYLARLEAENSPRAMAYLDRTENELARVAAITKQTLQFYRDPLAPTMVDAREILEEVLRLFATRLASKAIDTTLQADSGIFFKAIKGEIRQVLINLVGNAIDAVQHGGHIEAHGRRVESEGGEMVEIEIHDDGSGLSAAQAQRLFQPFVSSKGAHGTGLGLWVSKGIVEKHAGSIELTSQKVDGGNRTQAVVRLPVNIAAELLAQSS